MSQKNIIQLTSKAILVFAFLSSSPLIYAQQKVVVDKPSDTAWIQMMENLDVNYHKAVENFEAYWKNKRKPKEESDVFGEAEELNKQKKEEKFTDANEPAVIFF
jgi:hypothetical protein